MQHNVTENPKFGHCASSSLNRSHASSIPSSSPCLKLSTCLLKYWTLLIGKNFERNFFTSSSQFPFASMDANVYHLRASSSRENGKRFHLNQAAGTPSCCTVLHIIVNHPITTVSSSILYAPE